MSFHVTHRTVLLWLEAIKFLRNDNLYTVCPPNGAEELTWKDTDTRGTEAWGQWVIGCNWPLWRQIHAIDLQKNETFSKKQTNIEQTNQ